MRVFEINEKKCTSCLGCLASCPSGAIQFSDHCMKIDHDRCIACGSCYHRCKYDAVTIPGQVEVVKAFLRAKRKVILSIDPACIAFLPPNVTIEKLAAAVQELGVWDVADASEAAAAVGAEYARLVQEKHMDNIVFSACPVVRNLMEQFFPDTLKYLAPVASPMIAHGRMIKRDFTSAAVVYVSTCAARLEEARDVRHSTEINAVLSIGELMDWLMAEGINPADFEEEPLLSDGGGIGELSAIIGGMMECTEYFVPDHGMKRICVDGIANCRELLQELSAGQLSGCLIEMDACCGGCVGGTDGIRKEVKKRGKFAATLELRNFVEEHGKEPYFDTHGIAMANPPIDYGVEPYVPTEQDIDRMLHYMGVGNPRQQKNCGSCGYDSCRERAVAILHRREAVSICEPVVRENRLDTYYGIYQNVPLAVLLIDDSMRIVDFNREGAELFTLKPGQEKYVFELMDPSDVQYVLDTGLAIRQKRLDLDELYLRVEASFVPLPGQDRVLAVFRDTTEQELEEEKQLQSRLQSVEMAQRVIEKQMTVAQQIAFLLGETTAETKVTLNRLKDRILNEEDAQ